MKKSLLCLMMAGSFASSVLASDPVSPDGLAGLEPSSVVNHRLPDGRQAVTLGFNVVGSDTFSSKYFDGSSNFQNSPAKVCREAEGSNSVDFTYATGPTGALSFGELSSGATVTQAIYLPSSTVKKFAGNNIVGISFYNGVNQDETLNPVTEAAVYIANVKSKFMSAPLYKRTVTDLSTEPMSLNTVEVDSEFTISATQPLYVGFSTVPAPGSYYIIYDDVPQSNTNACHVGVKPANSNTIQWQNIKDYGALTIYVTIAGDNLPQDYAEIYDFKTPQRVDPGVPFSSQLSLINTGANDISSIEYEYTLAGSEPVTGSIDFSGEAIPYNSIATVSIDNMVTDIQGLDLPLNFKVTKVNGNDNHVDAKINTTLNCFVKEMGHAIKLLIEEGTGTWCGYCPVGITMMEYAAETYPDFYNRAALHYSSGTSPDPMQVSSTSAMSSFFSSSPTAYVNRWEGFHPAYFDIMLPNYAELYENEVTFAGITSMEASPVDEEGYVTINIGGSFAFDYEGNANFAYGLYLTEDHVGPYDQANYYSGYSQDVFGWEREPGTVNMFFDDVVRLMVGSSTGVANSIPTTIAKGETISFSTRQSVKAVTGDDYNVIAYIVDKKTKKIVNSSILKAKKSALTDIEAVEDVRSVKVSGGSGIIDFFGDYSSASVYTMSGQRVATVSDSSTLSVPAGLYIVNVDGKTSKILVR